VQVVGPVHVGQPRWIEALDGHDLDTVEGAPGRPLPRLERGGQVRAEPDAIRRGEDLEPVADAGSGRLGVGSVAQGPDHGGHRRPIDRRHVAGQHHHDVVVAGHRSLWDRHQFERGDDGAERSLPRLVIGVHLEPVPGQGVGIASDDHDPVGARGPQRIGRDQGQRPAVDLDQRLVAAHARRPAPGEHHSGEADRTGSIRSTGCRCGHRAQPP